MLRWRPQTLRYEALEVFGMTAAEWTETLDEVREAIAARAYDLFEARGGEPGRDHEDWIEAERQLQEEGVIPGGATTETEAVAADG